MNETTPISADGSLFLKRWAHFLWLLFARYPLSSEMDESVRRNSIRHYACSGVLVLVCFALGGPSISEGDYPSLNQANQVEGIVLREHKLKGGKYTSEPFVIETPQGLVPKKCARLGATCFDESKWSGIVGKPAKIWFWNEFILQIEVDGIVHPDGSYQRFKRSHTSNPSLFVWSLMGAPYLVFTLLRILRLYARTQRPQRSII